MARNQLKYEITAKDRSKQALRSVQRSLSVTQGAVSRLTRVMAPLAAIFSAGVLGRRLIETNKSFQKLQASLTTFTGSAEAGAQAFERIRNFASKTPFSVQEVTQSFNILIARGIKPTIAELAAFGDIASGSGKSFEQLAEAVADAAVGEFERLKEFGIKAGKEKDKIVLSFGGATQKIENDSASIIKALTGIAKSGFGGATARQAKTLEGAFSNFGDAVDSAAFAIGQQGLNKEINRVTRDFTKFISQNKEATRVISTGLVKGIRGLEIALKFLGRNIQNIATGLAVIFGVRVIRSIGLVGVALFRFVKAIVASQVALTALRLVTTKFGIVAVGLATVLGVAAATNDKFRDAIKKAGGELADQLDISDKLKTATSALARAFGLANLANKDLEQSAKDAAFSFINQENALSSLTKKTQPAITATKTLTDRLNNSFDGAKAGAKEYFDSIKDDSANAKEFVGNAFKSLEGTLSSFFQTGELDFDNFVDTIKKGLADLAARAVITTGVNFLSTIFPSLKFAQGGLVPGIGGPQSDNQLAALSPGEFVMRGSSVKKFGVPFMETINRGQVPGGGGGDMPEFGFGGFIRRITKTIRKVVRKVVDVVTDLVGKVSSAIRNIVQGILDGDLLTIISLASSFILPGLGTALVGSLGAGTGFINAVVAGVSKSFASGILGSGSLTAIAKSVAFQLGQGALVSSLSDAVVKGIDSKIGLGITGPTSSFAQNSAARFATLFNAASPFLEKRASGGPVRRGQPYLVGEQGPELFIPGSSGGISPSANSSQIVAAVNEVRDEMSALRRQFGRALSGGELVGARA